MNIRRFDGMRSEDIRPEDIKPLRSLICRGYLEETSIDDVSVISATPEARVMLRKV